MTVQLNNLTGGLSTGCARCGYDKHALKPGMRRGNQEVVDVTRARGRKRFYVRCGACGAVRKMASARPGEHCIKCRIGGSEVDTCGERITLDGETHNFAAWAKKLGITRQALHLRIANGWPLKRALTTPRVARGRGHGRAAA